MSKKREFYDLFHINSKMQRFLIKENDFTYKKLLKLLGPLLKTKKTVLDIGCGIGSISLHLASKGHKVMGVDVSAKAIKSAIDSANYCGLHNAVSFKVLNFPYEIPTGKYDLIICSEVLEHLENDAFAVHTINRLLRKDGVVIASSPSLKAPLYRLGLLNKFDEKVGHLRRYDKKTFVSLFRSEGLKIIKIEMHEGVLRNFLYTQKIGQLILKIGKRSPFSNLITIIDDISVRLIGESGYYVVARKK